MRPIILAIKLKYAEAILAGTKKCEFRKSPFPKDVPLVIIYASNGSGKIVGYFTIKRQSEDEPKEIWKRFSAHGGISKEEFDEYYHGTEKATCIEVEKVYKIEPPLDPFKCINGFVVPQSFRYMDKKDYACLLKKVELLKQKIIEDYFRNDKNND
jgi:predicted transcriptional regulator